MGRTNPTFRRLLERVESEWADYRRALRRRDQEVFDRLFEYARAHADAAGHRNHEQPMIAILLAMHLEQAKRIDDLETRLAEVADDDVQD